MANNANAFAAYQVARARAEALGFTYKPANEVANLPFDDILRRMTAISDVRTPVADETAILGGVEQPKVKVSDAFDIATRSGPPSLPAKARSKGSNGRRSRSSR